MKEINRFENSLLEKPRKQALARLEYALGRTKWSTQELIQATKGIPQSFPNPQPSSVQSSNSTLPQSSEGSRPSCTCRATSITRYHPPHRYNQKEATAILRDTRAQLSYPKASRPRYAEHGLPPALKFDTAYFHRFRLTDKHEMNSGLAFYLHTFNHRSPRAEARTRITVYLLKEIFYEKVRFEEQLGYDHNVDIFEGPSGGGLAITLQGDKDPGFAEMRIESILMTLNVSPPQP